MSGLMPTTSGRIEIQLDDPAQKARPYCGVVLTARDSMIHSAV